MRRHILYLAALAAAIAQPQTPRFKGIFEPVNVKADVKIFDVFFATEQKGWLAIGASEIRGGAIAYTEDGGNTWTTQYGDFESSDRAVSMLRFLDDHTGWAVQTTGSRSRLLHTTDGQNWIQSGNIQEHVNDYTFTSERHGIYVHGDEIAMTDDGGQHWKPVAACDVPLEVNGLVQRVHCEFRALHFPSVNLGYAVAKSGPASILFKSEDGGQTWKAAPIPGEGGAEDVFFVDANVGFVRTGYPDTGQLLRTNNGGASFTGVGGAPGDRMRFADPAVGWAFHYGKLTYTASGGDRWTSRSFNFPASVYGFCLPSRRRAYVVGEHGMVYRYSVVPVELAVPRAIDAPLMPGYDLPVAAEVQKMQPAIAALQADLQAAAKDAPAGVAPAASIAAPTDGAPPPAAAASAFQQDTTAAAFVQDTGALAITPGPALAGCCAADVQALQTSVAGFSQSVPKMVTRYRGLNLLLGAFQLFTDLSMHFQGVNNSFKAMKSAPNSQSALAALTQFSGELNQMAQSAGRLMQPTPR